jgi:hypothetical protein
VMADGERSALFADRDLILHDELAERSMFGPRCNVEVIVSFLRTPVKNL